MGFIIKNNVLIKYEKEEGVTEVIIPDGVTKITEWAFGILNKKTKIRLPGSINTICINQWDPYLNISEIEVQDGCLPKWNKIEIEYKFDSMPFGGINIKINGLNNEFAIIRTNIDYEETLAVRKEASKSIRSVDGYFDFEAFDAIFDIVKKVPSKAVVASYRYLYPYKLTKENKVKFEKWLKKHAEKVGRYWIDEKNEEVISGLYEKGIFDDKTVATLKLYAKEENLLDIVKSLPVATPLNQNTSKVEVDSSKFTKWLNEYIEARKAKAAKNTSFVIEDGVLIKYEGPSEIAIIPDGVKKIGAKAFYRNINIREIIIPDGVTEIGENAFSYCSLLETLIIPNTVKTVRSRYDFTHNIFDRCKSLRILVLPSIFAKQIAEDIRHAFDKNDRFYSENYLKLMVLPNAIYSDFDNYYKEFTITCKRASALGFMLAKELYANNIDYEQYRKYALAQRKKLLPEIYDLDLVEALEFYDSEKKITPKTIDEYTDIIPIHAVKCIQYLENWKLKNSNALEELNKQQAKEGAEILKLIKEDSLREVDKKFSDLYGMKIKDLPAVKDKDGKVASPYIFATLLYKEVPNYVFYNSYMREWYFNYNAVKTDILKIGTISASLLNILDSVSLQDALIKIVESVVGYTKKTKKHDLLSAISFYASEDTMKKVLELGSQMKISTDYLYPYWCFNSTKTAILYADKKKYMEMYAKLRLYEEDEFREKYLSECGLDEDGSIVFDLGDRTIKASLKSNYTFALTDSDGKELKTFPRKSTDKEKLKNAKTKYEETKLTMNSIFKNLKKRRMEDYLTGKAISGKEWINSYMKEPIHKLFASALVWVQDKKTFTVSQNTFVDMEGNLFEFDEKMDVKIAHVMEMEQMEIDKWRNYFLINHLIQPFEQVWELPINFNSVEKGRYEGISLNHKILMGKSAHGIIYYKPMGWPFGDYPELKFMNGSLTMPLLADIEKEDHITFGKLKVVKQDRIANHVIYLFDKWTVFGRIAKDDVSVMNFMDMYNLPQIKEFIDIASKNKAKNLSAALLNYKNSRFPEYDSFDEFILEDL